MQDLPTAPSPTTTILTDCILPVGVVIVEVLFDVENRTNKKRSHSAFEGAISEQHVITANLG